MKTLIIEDEFVAAQSLQRLITQADPEIEIIASLQSIEESVEWFSVNPMPELAFMDIQLADGSSFSIFEKVDITCPIIFTTAYNEYALKAFEVNSIDYLLKPITRTKLERALNKLKQFSYSQENTESIKKLLSSLQESKPHYKSHFLIPHRDKLLPLSAHKIAYIYSEYKMAKIVTVDKESFTIDTSLEEILKQLDPDCFFRANRQYIVSHKAINDLSIWFGGKLSVNLFVSTPERIIVSRARAGEFKEWFVSAQKTL